MADRAVIAKGEFWGNIGRPQPGKENMTLMQETSITAYYDLVRSGKICRTELRILEAIDNYGPMTDFEIVQKTGMPIQGVTGRRNALARKKFVVIRGTKRNPVTGKKNIIWGIYNRLI